MNETPLVLAVETSAARGAVALLAGRRLLGEREFPRGRGGAGAGTPAAAAERLLESAGRKAAEVGLVAVSIGPGSYTGLRVGVSFAKAFAWATGAAAVPVSSLLALAASAPESGGGGALLAPAADAFRGQIYARALRRGDAGELEPLTADLVLAPEALAGALRPLASGAARWRVFGSAAARHGRTLAAALAAAGLAAELSAEPAAPAAAAVGRLGLERFSAGKAVTAHDLAPVYLRRTEAEERLEARAKET